MDKDYGAEVKRLRTSLGLTMRELGDMFGVSDSMISHIEHNRPTNEEAYQVWIDRLVSLGADANQAAPKIEDLPDTTDFMKRLAELSTLYNRSLSDFYQSIGLSRQQVSNYNLKKRKINQRSIQKIAKALGIPYDALIDMSISPEELVSQYKNEISPSTSNEEMFQKIKSFVTQTTEQVSETAQDDPQVFAAHFPNGIDYASLDQNGQELLNQFFQLVLRVCPANAGSTN